MSNNGNMKDAVYNSILDGIFHNEFKPNEIINEKEVIQRLGFSKTPVREGLIALCKDNVLRSIPRCGYEVVRLTREDVENMLRTRYLLEGGILRTTYDKFTPTQLRRLEQLDEECTRYRADLWEHWESNTKFHLQLMSPSRNEYAIDILNQTMGRLKRAYSQFFWDRMEELDLSMDTRQHHFLIEAIYDKDLPAIMNLLIRDLQHFGDIHCEITDYFAK